MCVFRSLGPTMRNKDSRGYPVALPHSPVKEILPDVFFVKGTATYEVTQSRNQTRNQSLS